MSKKIVITGGCGFIGSNAANYYLLKGWRVVAFDNLSRRGTKENLAWLRKLPATSRFSFVKGDIRYDQKLLEKTFRSADVILHLAAQVAVTTSVVDPRTDFDINAHGTFNVLEAARYSPQKPILLYSSTNKVYGGMEDIKVKLAHNRYQYRDLPRGIPENRLLDFHSPYGCSKGCADQYVRDYARIYGLRTVVFRQSCIYGYRQFGVEDQGWVAWFTIASLFNKKLTIYGDGQQVRDVLFVDDLIAAYDAAIKKIKVTAGQVYNVGGGSHNQMSLLELIAFLEKFYHKKIPYSFADWRPGDQPVFVCDIRRARKDFGWQPHIPVALGVKKLSQWVKANRTLFKKVM